MQTAVYGCHRGHSSIDQTISFRDKEIPGERKCISCDAVATLYSVVDMPLQLFVLKQEDNENGKERPGEDVVNPEEAK